MDQPDAMLTLEGLSQQLRFAAMLLRWVDFDGLTPEHRRVLVGTSDQVDATSRGLDAISRYYQSGKQPAP